VKWTGAGRIRAQSFQSLLTLFVNQAIAALELSQHGIARGNHWKKSIGLKRLYRPPWFALQFYVRNGTIL
jgi:hypothetical protein